MQVMSVSHLLVLAIVNKRHATKIKFYLLQDCVPIYLAHLKLCGLQQKVPSYGCFQHQCKYQKMKAKILIISSFIFWSQTKTFLVYSKNSGTGHSNTLNLYLRLYYAFTLNNYSIKRNVCQCVENVTLLSLTQ